MILSLQIIIIIISHIVGGVQSFKFSHVPCVFDWQIYPSDHNSNNFSSTPSTPVGSPQGIASKIHYLILSKVDPVH